ncbi:hypothetical protein NQ318_017550 [Aromia moschata]|uniref:Uncharacterized protein n=1 Tax=Aromia moschata TaxID=1265417 RepID=A0AAV8Z200_9CUCU|nr:hypothetical protein NQ318_017550 [Aromia moschata]
MVGRGLQSLWARLTGEENKDTFIGRCFGVARKLKFVMPMIIFKLGVIVTTLAFLTIFSLKSLSLLGLLLLINVSGAISKIAAALGGHQNGGKPPQTVHFHVHQDKEGPHFVGHGWDDRLGQSGSGEDFTNSDYYNLYYKLLNKNPSLKSYRD